MIWITWLGAIFVILGVLYTANAAVRRGRMSEPHSSPTAARTLEPRQSGIRAFGLKDNWPGILLILIGAIMLLYGAW
ncbi:hypothetical protein [Aquamicrobium sp. LC103]|uniref:hypothetical protein n=1 Tax=Aquamicrobium sp. LC103 TaxID=1120658 RepID=UPI00063EC9F7|nr:hypothetical protein [Aquamicrobium sp. LC103]TKT76358.1 hypothetical protein XW59_017475 [Aquamicrobium sp. LC103]